MKTFLNVTGIIALAATIAAFGATAQAAQPTAASHRSVTVTYNDLDLSSQAGIGKLYNRLEKAVDKVCSPREDLRNLVMFRDWQHCLDAALDDAVRQMNLPALARVHFEATGRSLDQGPRVAGAN